MTVVAGLFLLLFGGAASWLLAVRFPEARFTRIGYGTMTVGGVFFLVWAISGWLPAGVAAVIIVALGAIAGIVGAFLKELRFELPR